MTVPDRRCRRVGGTLLLLAALGAAASESPPPPKLESTSHHPQWSYTEDVTVHSYVQTIPWRSPDPASFPWIVAKAAGAPDPRPVGLALHGWGGNRADGWLWWYNGRPDGGGAGGYRGAILVASDHTPASVREAGHEQYDWWTGARLDDGKVHPVTQDRLLQGLDYLLKQHGGDPTRVFVWGNSMGGSGAAQMAFAHPGRFAFAISAVGVYVPHRSPQFRGAYEDAWGSYAWRHATVAGNGRDVWEHHDLARRLREEPARDLPLIIFANGRRDAGIGWEQAVIFFRALQEARQPHVFRWTDTGHDARPLLPGRERPSERDLGIDVRLDRSLPAFTRGSLDDDPGDGDPQNGTPEGQANLHLGWSPESVVDEPDRWEAVLWLSRAAPADSAIVDVTPRRLRRFHVRPGDTFRWRAGSTSGEIAADAHGRVTATRIPVPKDGVRLTIERAHPIRFPAR